MNRKLYISMLVLALSGGVIGGVLSRKIPLRGQALAQNSARHETVPAANTFRVVDKQGKTRAVLGLTSEFGQPGLWLIDQDGKVRASLILDRKQQPALFFADRAGRIRTELRVEKGVASNEEYASLILRDSEQNVRTHLMAGMGFFRARSPSLSQLELSTYFLRLKDKDGSVLWRAPYR